MVDFNGVVYRLFHKRISIMPLVTFRIAFGLVTAISTIRFLCLGWVEEQYLKPVFHFTYYGLAWVQVLPAWCMYGLFGIMFLASIGIMLGLFYRICTIVFFLSFTYVELLDKAYYLNHYYFVSLVSFLLCFVPAHRFYSLDVRRNPSRAILTVPAWSVNIFKFQIACLYFFAGLAKIHSSWLLDAMPLRIWLPANDDMPILGVFLRQTWVAYVFSWVGMLYDLSIPFLLLWKRSRLVAYLILLMFHLLTGYFFQIGVFPLVMSVCTLLFFSDSYHEKLLSWISRIFGLSFSSNFQNGVESAIHHPRHAMHRKLVVWLLASYVIVQLVLPFRYLAYPGNLFWTEDGFRFSWRVMLVEKAGSAIFRIKDKKTGNEFEAINRQFLNAHQEKQMAFQPNMMLQYAHFLGHYYKQQGLADISVFCECYVTMNGAPSRLILDPNTDLLLVKESFLPKEWVKPN